MNLMAARIPGGRAENDLGDLETAVDADASSNWLKHVGIGIWLRMRLANCGETPHVGFIGCTGHAGRVNQEEFSGKSQSSREASSHGGIEAKRRARAITACSLSPRFILGEKTGLI